MSTATLRKDNSLALLQQTQGKPIEVSPSPFMLWLKPVVLHAEQGSLSFQYVVRKEMTNPMGTLHGGVIAGIVDDTIGATLFTFNEQHFYTTVSLAIDYFLPARHCDIIVAKTNVIKKGNRMVNVSCEIWNEDMSKLLAKGTSNLLKTTLLKC